MSPLASEPPAHAPLGMHGGGSVLARSLVGRFAHQLRLGEPEREVDPAIGDSHLAVDGRRQGDPIFPRDSFEAQAGEGDSGGGLGGPRVEPAEEFFVSGTVGNRDELPLGPLEVPEIARRSRASHPCARTAWGSRGLSRFCRGRASLRVIPRWRRPLARGAVGIRAVRVGPTGGRSVGSGAAGVAGGCGRAWCRGGPVLGRGRLDHQPAGQTAPQQQPDALRHDPVP